MKKIVIVGAGASGVYLAILLKQKIPDIQVVILEQNATSLKKLLATGNGRCNLSNQDMSIDYYFSDRLDIVETIIQDFDMVQRMHELGLYTIYQGKLLYPKSEQALSVKRILMQAAEDLGVLFLYGEEVLSVNPQMPYVIKTNQQTITADYVIFAMGSQAGKLSGIQSSRYNLLKELHLQVIEPMPSLVQMYTFPVLKKLKGVRVKGTFTLLENQKCIRKEKGELLFTDYGVSGIAIMQLSAFYQKNHHYQLSIDFFDEMDEQCLSRYIKERLKKNYHHFYDGLVNNKLSAYLESLSAHSVQQIVSLLKDFRLDITGLRNYETAQVMKGGLALQEVDENLQIQRYKHMYAIGEILNVDGLCGGYNLHFAFASAYRVAQAIEREIYVKS